MPVYLLHGFRWPRPLIRIHIILQNLDDAAAEWLVAPDTTECMLENFTELYPDAMDNLPDLRFVEQYDPDDLSTSSQPYAYVADMVHDIKLGIDVDDVRGKGVSNEQWSALLELRDKIAPEEKVGWFVVYCGDEDRFAGIQLDESDYHSAVSSPIPTAPVSMGPPSIPMPGSSGHLPHSANESNQYDVARRPRTAGSSYTSSTGTRKDHSSPDLSRKSHSSTGNSRKDLSSPETQQSGLKRLLGSLKRRTSRASIKGGSSPASTNGHFAPPVPPLPRQAV